MINEDDVPKKIELALTNYTCNGSVNAILWGGGDAYITMDEYTTSDLTDKAIIEGINDGQFGVESIIRAVVSIYANYEGKLVFLEHREYSRNEILAGEREVILK